MNITKRQPASVGGDDHREALTRYRGPVAFLLAVCDEVVDVEPGQQLYDSYGGPKWLHIEMLTRHNTLPFHPGAQYHRPLSTLLRPRV